MKQFITDLFQIIFKSFSGKNIFAHILAIGLTAAIVLSGFDWYYFSLFHAIGFGYYLFPAAILGAFVPIFLPIYLLLSAKILKNKRRWTAAIALTLSVLAGSIISSFYKAFTGRIPPNQFDLINDISNGFNFGFLKHGIFWGWPSSHTTIAFAMAFTLIGLFPKNNMVRVCAFLYALYIGIGISTNIHWFSEFISGAIIGTVIGISTSTTFKNRI